MDDLRIAGYFAIGLLGYGAVGGRSVQYWLFQLTGAAGFTAACWGALQVPSTIGSAVLASVLFAIGFWGPALVYIWKTDGAQFVVKDFRPPLSAKSIFKIEMRPGGIIDIVWSGLIAGALGMLILALDSTVTKSAAELAGGRPLTERDVELIFARTQVWLGVFMQSMLAIGVGVAAMMSILWANTVWRVRQSPDASARQQRRNRRDRRELDGIDSVLDYMRAIKILIGAGFIVSVAGLWVGLPLVEQIDQVPLLPTVP